MKYNECIGTDLDLIKYNNTSETITSIVYNGIEYLNKFPDIKSLVIGLSGGIDSTVVALLSFELKESISHRDITIIGVSMPTSSNKQDEVDRANRVGADLCNKFLTIPIDRGDIFDFVNEIDNQNKPLIDDFKSKVRVGNAIARRRMSILYDIALANNGIVMSTDNYTEYMLGFWTLHGDVGDFGLIQNLWKTEVYNIAMWFEENNYDLNQETLRKIIDATPTDGLGITESDFDQLGCNSYKEADAILITYLKTKEKHLELHPIIQRHLNSEFKRQNPVNIERNKII